MTDVTDLNIQENNWRVSGFKPDGSVLQPVLEGSNLTAHFTMQNKIDGSGGCNHYFAKYTIAGKQLKLGKVLSTRKACATPAGIMQQESLFFQALETVASYRFVGKQLQLLSDAGEIVVMLEQNPASTLH